MKKHFIKSTVVLASFMLLSLSFGQVSYAQGATGPSSDTGGYVCDSAKFSILKMLDSFSTSIVSTAMTHSEALTAIKPFYMAVGMSHAEMMGCMPYIARNVFPGQPASTALLSLNCSETDVAICTSLLNQYNVGGRQSASGYDPVKFAKSKVSGSLLGMAYFVQNTMEYEPVPVNTAFFFRDYAAKLPIIGETVYAQNVTDYGHTFINAILNMWKVFRNIAYALMAVIMLWVGFAIITRRKISAQTVVNVQYALPKIVIALIFIALSYPIGALITSLSWTLFHSSGEIIMSIIGPNMSASALGGMSFQQSLLAAEKLGAGGNAALTMLIMVASAGSGGLMALFGFVFAVVIAFWLFAYLKAFWIYLKMVISTAISPLQIALYALPGNDDKLENWLKQMVAWGAGIFGMALILDLLMAFSLDLLLQAFIPVLTGGGLGQQLVSGSLFNVIIAPAMTIFGAVTAIQAPNKIEEMIMGPKKGGKR
jgi:hypothetical protein